MNKIDLGRKINALAGKEYKAQVLVFVIKEYTEYVQEAYEKGEKPMNVVEFMETERIRKAIIVVKKYHAQFEKLVE